MNQIWTQIEVNEHGAPEIDPKELQPQLSSVELIDVRRPDEYSGELGHIDGAKLITLGGDLDQFFSEADKSKHYVFVCRSGARSSGATLQAQSLGFSSVVNLKGGMLRWNALKLPITR